MSSWGMELEVRGIAIKIRATELVFEINQGSASPHWYLRRQNPAIHIPPSLSIPCNIQIGETVAYEQYGLRNILELIGRRLTEFGYCLEDYSSAKFAESLSLYRSDLKTEGEESFFG